MRLINWTKDKIAGQKVRINAQWRDQMKRPANVSIQITKGELAHDGASTLVEGENEDAMRVLYACADIAWDNGWRPRGLLGAIPAFIQGFKLPPEAK